MDKKDSRTLLTTILVLFVSVQLCAQALAPVSFQPIPGDTLEIFEREELGLFGDVDGFLWAVFLISETGGSLKAKVCSIQGERVRLQIMDMGITPEFLRRKIERESGRATRLTVGSGQPQVARRKAEVTRTPNPSVDSLIVLSPTVGEEIDPAESKRFGILSSVRGFRSAVFFRTSDTSFYARVSVQEGRGPRREAYIQFTESEIRRIIERIDLVGPSAAGLRPSTYLPLAENTADLPRPSFPAIHLDIGVGAGIFSFSGIDPLLNGGSDVSLLLTFLVDLPLSFDQSFSFLGGTGFAVGGLRGGRLFSYSGTVLVRLHGSPLSFNPLVGFGMGHTDFEYEGNVIVKANETYPLIVFGAEFVDQVLSVLLTVPIAKTLSTTFEGTSYSIRPAGPSLGIKVCL